MLKKNIFKTIFFLLLILTFFGFLNNKLIFQTEAETLCPSSMDPDSVECYNYLNEKSEELRKQQGTLQQKLKEEEYQQLSLSEKISYITQQVSQTEKVIKSLEVEIAASDVQIKLLEKGIQEKEDGTSLMKQEITLLESSVTKRITEAYKYSFVGPLELILDSDGLGSILRKTKYLAVTRSQDKESLEDFGKKVDYLKKEEEKLQKQKAELQLVRNSIEEEKTELFDEKQNLAQQKAEKDRLLAQSKANEVVLLAELKQKKEQQAVIDAQIIAYINAHLDEAVDSGPVSKGTIIGYVYPGGNSCSGSTGPHLHFAASTTSSGDFYANINLYSQGYLRIGSPSGLPAAADGWEWPYLLPGHYAVPMSGPGVYITQDYHDPNGNYKQDLPRESQYYATDISRIGGSANAPVLAAEAGTLRRGVDYCGQSYAVINHPNGYRTIYVHLR